MSVVELDVIVDGKAAERALQPDDVLVLPLARSALLQRIFDEHGAPALTLYVRDKEITWDDPRHFVFAEALLSGSEFTAAEVADAGGLDLTEVAPMLQGLIDEGLVIRAEDCPTSPARHDNRPTPSPLPPAPMAQVRTWMDNQSLMAELTGTALDNYWLEAVVPVFRTCHIFLDRDQRHIGEANAFPAAARTEVPTEWRGCPYAGNRYHAEKPMNMTALKAMRAHWRQMMGLLAPIRESYLSRFPDARNGWTVAHVERLSVCVLALPSFMLLRCDKPVANGDLHPALSNLFRVTDGLRMVMHHMMFVPVFEPMHKPDAPVTIDAILAYADRNFLFHSDHGVCAGPRFMVEDFLAVLLSGEAPRSGFDATIDPELSAAAAFIEPALDYGLLGLQSFATVFSLWPAMARCYDQLHSLLSSVSNSGNVRAIALRDRFAGHFAALSHRSFLASEEWRTHRDTVYDDMFASCSKGLNDWLPEMSLSALLSMPNDAPDAQSKDALSGAVAQHFSEKCLGIADEFAETVMTFLERARSVVALTETIQAQTAVILHRPEPVRGLTVQDINLHNVLMGSDQRSVPFLADELGQLFDLHIHVDAQHIQISHGYRHALHHSPT